MTGQQVGYIRVSSAGQNEGRQLEGLELDRVFKEKVSGKDRKRPELNRCMEHLREDDILHVHSLDRLGRSLIDLESIVSELVAKGVRVQFHKEQMTFSQENNGSMGKLMFQILGAFSEFERNLIKERQAEGIEQAKKAGKHLGRHPKLSSEKQAELIQEHRGGNTNISSLAKEFNVSRATVYNVLKQQTAKGQGGATTS